MMSRWNMGVLTSTIKEWGSAFHRTWWCGLLVPKMGRWSTQTGKDGQTPDTTRDVAAGTPPTSDVRDNPWLMLSSLLGWKVILAGWCVNMVLNSPLFEGWWQDTLCQCTIASWEIHVWNGGFSSWPARHVWLPDGSPFVKGSLSSMNPMMPWPLGSLWQFYWLRWNQNSKLSLKKLRKFGI